MSYGDKLKQKSTKIKTSENVLDTKKIKNKKSAGRPRKSDNEVRNVAIPIALNQKEKDWIEKQALDMSKQIGIKVTTSAWMRMVLLKGMEK